MTREETIERLKRRIDCIENGALCSDFGSDKEVFDMAIKALEQEPKTGHWIIKDDKEQGYDIGGVKTWYVQIMCSECGFIKTAIEGHTGQYKYCPSCGARMVEPQESEE